MKTITKETWMDEISNTTDKGLQWKQKHQVFCWGKIFVFGSAKLKRHLEGPARRLVLWWMSFQMTESCCSVVFEVPTVKTSLAFHALCRSRSTFCPSALFGRKACCRVPANGWPGFGCSGYHHKDDVWMEIWKHSNLEFSYYSTYADMNFNKKYQESFAYKSIFLL